MMHLLMWLPSGLLCADMMETAHHACLVCHYFVRMERTCLSPVYEAVSYAPFSCVLISQLHGLQAGKARDKRGRHTAVKHADAVTDAESSETANASLQDDSGLDSDSDESCTEVLTAGCTTLC